MLDGMNVGVAVAVDVGVGVAVAVGVKVVVKVGEAVRVNVGVALAVAVKVDVALLAAICARDTGTAFGRVRARAGGRAQKKKPVATINKIKIQGHTVG